jgi:hypothetical protein
MFPEQPCQAENVGLVMNKHARRKSADPPDPASLPGPVKYAPPKGHCQQPRMLDVATLRSNPILRHLVERAMRTLRRGKRWTLRHGKR